MLTALAVSASVLVAGPVAATQQAATQQAATQQVVEPGRFAPLTPARVLDTRQDGGRVAAGADRTVTLLGRGGVPATGVSAVVLNVTVTGGTARGDLQVHPDGRRPARRTSNLNWAAGQTAAVQVQTGVGAGGRVVLSVSTGAAHVVVDVFGWYGDGSDPRADDGFTALPPARVLDTRLAGGPVQAGTPRRVPLAGQGAVPAEATAVALNATVLGTPANADLQVFPTGARPDRRTSNLNVARGQTRANAVVMPVGADGSISLDISESSAHVVLDVVGWYGPGASGRFVPVVPTRVLDTRDDRAPVVAGQDRLHVVAGDGAVPLNASAAVLSVTATGATAPLDLQVYPPGDRPQQRTSTLNLHPATAVPNLAVARLGSGGRVGLSPSQGSVHVVLDVLGYVTSASWSVCRNAADGWTAEYPGSWQTNSGAVMQTCRLFDPEPIVLEPSTEIPPDVAVNLGRNEVGVEVARSDPHSRLVAERTATVDGRPAYRQERVTTQDGYVPAGTAYVIWLVDLGGETLSGTAWDHGEPPFPRKVEVLDAMMGRLSIDGPDEGHAPGSWRTLPPAPVEPRRLHTTTWAGDRLVVWSGGDDTGVHDDGAAWLPAEQRWEPVPSAPVAARWNAAAVWTGTELLVWGGDEGPDDQASCFRDGARYDPVARTWQPVPPAPGPERCGAAVEWTGTELLVWGGHVGGAVPTEADLSDDGVAFDPATGQWRTLPAAPLSPRTTPVSGWSGTELLVWGGTGAGVEPVGGGAAYDPDADRWRALPESPLPPRAGAVGTFAGGELVVLGGHDRSTDSYRTDAAAYDPASDTWRALPDLPRGQVQPAVAWTGSALLVVGGDPRSGTPSDGAFLELSGGTWTVRPEPPGGPRIQHDVAWSGARLYTWGGVSGDGDAAPGASWRPPA